MLCSNLGEDKEYTEGTNDILGRSKQTKRKFRQDHFLLKQFQLTSNFSSHPLILHSLASGRVIKITNKNEKGRSETHEEEGNADKKEGRTRPEENADRRGDSKIELSLSLLFSRLDNKRKNAEDPYAMEVWPERGSSAKLRVAQKPVPAAADEVSPHYSSVYSELVTNPGSRERKS
jgi:hypothetical protein